MSPRAFKRRAGGQEGDYMPSALAISSAAAVGAISPAATAASSFGVRAFNTFGAFGAFGTAPATFGSSTPFGSSFGIAPAAFGIAPTAFGIAPAAFGTFGAFVKIV